MKRSGRRRVCVFRDPLTKLQTLITARLTSGALPHPPINTSDSCVVAPTSQCGFFKLPLQATVDTHSRLTVAIALKKIHEKARRRTSSREEKGELLKTTVAAGKSKRCREGGEECALKHVGIRQKHCLIWGSLREL